MTYLAEPFRGKAPTILLIEDDQDTANLIMAELTRQLGDGHISHVITLAQTNAMDLSDFDLAMVDLNVPDARGLDVVESLLGRRPDLPIVVVTCEDNLRTAIAAIRGGAYDYIVKAPGYLPTLSLVVEKNLELRRIRKENQQLHQKLTTTLDQLRVKNRQLEQMVEGLEAMATTDGLTGLANRRAFNDALERSFSEATRYGHDLACIMIDMDNFKVLNDTFGHLAGDEVLRCLARLLVVNCRRCDVAARYGGDEFILLLPQSNPQVARQVAMRIAGQFHDAICASLGRSTGLDAFTVSIGVACMRASRPVNSDQLVAQTDEALYHAKHAGKARIAMHSNGDDESTCETVSALSH